MALSLLKLVLRILPVHPYFMLCQNDMIVVSTFPLSSSFFGIVPEN
jgi:hypothetical protein